MGNEFSCAIDDVILQAQTFGNGKSVTFPGNPDEQTISGTQCFHIKFTAGIFYPFCGKGVYLQFAVMGGNSSTDFPVMEIRNNSHSQCGAFRRICTCTQFVEQHQRMVCHIFQNLDDICHVRRESTQALLNALFIPDVRENFIKHCQLGMVVGRDMQTCLPHKGE